MPKKQNRSGGKFGGRHTTFIPGAAQIADEAVKYEEVTKVIPGIIDSGLRSSSGQKRMKITPEDNKLFIAVRENANHQKIIVCTPYPEWVQNMLQQKAVELNFDLK